MAEAELEPVARWRAVIDQMFPYGVMVQAPDTSSHGSINCAVGRLYQNAKGSPILLAWPDSQKDLQLNLGKAEVRDGRVYNVSAMGGTVVLVPTPIDKRLPPEGYTVDRG